MRMQPIVVVEMCRKDGSRYAGVTGAASLDTGPGSELHTMASMRRDNFLLEGAYRLTDEADIRAIVGANTAEARQRAGRAALRAGRVELAYDHVAFRRDHLDWLLDAVADPRRGADEVVRFALEILADPMAPEEALAHAEQAITGPGNAGDSFVQERPWDVANTFIAAARLTGAQPPEPVKAWFEEALRQVEAATVMAPG